MVVPDPSQVVGSDRNYSENFRLSRQSSGPSGELLTSILEGFLSVHQDMPGDDSDPCSTVEVVLNSFKKS